MYSSPYPVIAVTNRKLCPGDFLEQIKRLSDAGVPRIILREKDLSVEEYQRLAEKVLAICGGTPTECILHSYVEVAQALGVTAIHLPLPLAEQSRDKLGSFTKIGISTHSMEQVRRAEDAGATYLTYGHVFPTTCKPNLPPRGIAALREICRSTSLPVYAIGGITPENALEARAAGAAGVCIMSAAMQSCW
jgi:thiamine-phosphate pyrophosphorylase